MDAHSVSSRKDISESPSSERKTHERSQSLPSSWTHACSSNPKDSDDCFNDVLDGFSLGESSFYFVNSPYASSLFSSHLSSSSSLSDLQGEIEEETEDHVSLESRCVCFGNPSKRRGLFPPPITCLKSFQAGKRYVYLNFIEDDDNFIVEEIRIPRDIFHASREGGSLKLYFACSSEDECRNMEGEEK